MSAPSIEQHPDIDLPLLQDLLRPNHFRWSPAELRTLTSRSVALLGGPLRSVLRFTEPQRWWTMLGRTDGVELWLLSWLPGQHTEPHDHGGAAGAFGVLQGEITETYRYPAGPIRVQRHVTGAAIGFGAGRAHEVRNLGTARAATVHAYSPPLVPTRQYASLRDIPAEIPTIPTIPALPG